MTTHFPFLAISASDKPRDIMKGLEAGSLRYLTKPIKTSGFMLARDLALILSKLYVPNRSKCHDAERE